MELEKYIASDDRFAFGKGRLKGNLIVVWGSFFVSNRLFSGTMEAHGSKKSLPATLFHRGITETSLALERLSEIRWVSLSCHIPLKLMGNDKSLVRDDSGLQSVISSAARNPFWSAQPGRV